MKTKSFEIELLHNVDKEFKDDFYKYSKTLEYSKGSCAFSSDDLLNYFYIVLDGKIKTYQINFENSKEQTIFIYQRGDMFDVISLLDEKPHEVIYEVLQDCRVLRLPIERVRYWINNNPTFNKIFFPYIASKMRYIEDLATELSLYDVKDRLIHLLIENLNPNNKFKYRLLQNLSNSEVSKLLGTVRHVLERVLKQLKSENIIQTSRKNIRVKNFQKLLDKTTKMLLK
ncbi:Crp/Fnr family transcriptional regulator [Sulfurimonas sp. CVO]|jgi:CRP-like cAMP-binding protein|uniref:Crp/Fnr family transcriptional regulator n=1 Tax=Sulfurimonas xiamenensis TaxID=2590021 RepID=A0AAJ4DMI5_9BACT|nr:MULTISPECIES: Crp/Fnr family transcriptional regulator [Sulfurimonas]PLY14237.1 MAG: cyclic nucleotide-binding protein [Sulfurimonas sp.]QFR43179.1 Crp/Fnr family transcriptional regulator [Sulfurimonas xiamenensis]QHG91271.1 Crp/Fnr family transcriptional regulator [Sulfurimonas sp. CVO]